MSNKEVLYRAGDYTEGVGIKAKKMSGDLDKEYTPNFHITSGSTYDTCYISTTKNPSVAKMYSQGKYDSTYQTERKRVVLIDRTSLEEKKKEKVLDCCSGKIKLGETAKNFAQASQEVLVIDEIEDEFIKVIPPIWVDILQALEMSNTYRNHIVRRVIEQMIINGDINLENQFEFMDGLSVNEVQMKFLEDYYGINGKEEQTYASIAQKLFPCEEGKINPVIKNKCDVLEGIRIDLIKKCIDQKGFTDKIKEGMDRYYSEFQQEIITNVNAPNNELEKILEKHGVFSDNQYSENNKNRSLLNEVLGVYGNLNVNNVPGVNAAGIITTSVDKSENKIKFGKSLALPVKSKTEKFKYLPVGAKYDTVKHEGNVYSAVFLSKRAYSFDEIENQVVNQKYYTHLDTQKNIKLEIDKSKDNVELT